MPEERTEMERYETVENEENLKLSDLPSPKEVLAMLRDALKELSEPGLSISEIRRLRGVINAARVYHGLFRAYLKYQKLLNQANRKFVANA